MEQREVFWATIGRLTIQGLLLGALLGATFGTLVIPLGGTIVGALYGGVVGFPLGTVNGLVMVGLAAFTEDGPRLLKAPGTIAACCSLMTFVGALFAFSLVIGGSFRTTSLFFVDVPAFIAAIASFFATRRIARLNQGSVE